MNRTLPSRLLVLLVTLSIVAAACSDDSTGDAETGTSADPSLPADSSTTTTTPETTTTTTPEAAPPLPIPAATLTEIVAPGSPWAQSTSFDLTPLGYTQTEYVLAGTARSFTSEDAFADDGQWSVVPDDEADYRTRVLVNRPADPADFNGTLVVEWFNVSGGLDAAPDWTMIHTELIREGYAWLGVSAQFVGVEGRGGAGLDVGFPLHLKANNEARYGDLSHPGDSYSYDIYTQATQALLDPGAVDPLAGLDVEQTIAVGESQSAFRLTTYVNAIDPVTQIFDGFLVHSRGNGSARLTESDDGPAMPDQVLIRDDVRVPVLTFETETDIFRLEFLAARQPDTDMIRLWEAAGTSHNDTYGLIQSIGPVDLGDDPAIADLVVEASPIPRIIECDTPINSGPQHWLMKGAVHALNEWVVTGAAPPEAPRLEVDDAGTAFVLDDLGNVAGGIRSPWVDAPIAVLSGAGQGGDSFCGLFGTTVPFDDATIAFLYPDHDAYVAAVEASLATAVDGGYIRPADADLIRRSATASDIGEPTT